MAIQNPCCINLRAGTQVVAILNVAITGIFLIFHGILFFISLGFTGLALYMKGLEDKTISYVAIVGMLLLLSIGTAFYFIESINLFVGVSKRDIKKCRKWIIMQFIFLVSIIAQTIWNVCNILTEGGRIVEHIVVSILGTMLVLYQIWVVYAFMEQLKREERNGGNVTVIYQSRTGAEITSSKPEELSVSLSPQKNGIYPQIDFSINVTQPTFKPTKKGSGSRV